MHDSRCLKIQLWNKREHTCSSPVASPPISPEVAALGAGLRALTLAGRRGELPFPRGYSRAPQPSPRCCGQGQAVARPGPTEGSRSCSPRGSDPDSRGGTAGSESPQPDTSSARAAGGEGPRRSGLEATPTPSPAAPHLF